MILSLAHIVMKGMPFHILQQEARRPKGGTLKSVSLVTGIDAALLSHIESGRRKATGRSTRLMTNLILMRTGIPR